MSAYWGDRPQDPCDAAREWRIERDMRSAPLVKVTRNPQYRAVACRLLALRAEARLSTPPDTLGATLARLECRKLISLSPSLP
jgi:hypothetical protein